MRETFYDLFSCKAAHASIELPIRLGTLAEKIERYDLTFDSLLIGRTLFPFYMAFAQEELSESVYKWAKYSEPSSMYTELGLFACGKNGPKSLRFCPECYLEERREYGEGYWHRIHQTPGALVCERHFCQLLDSNIQYRIIRGNKYSPADIKSILPPTIPTPLSIEDYHKAILITLDIKWLYQNYYRIRAVFAKNDYSFRDLFIWQLGIKGLATDNGSLRIKKYRTAFNNFFGPDLLNILGLGISEEDVKKAWIINMCRTGENPMHPLKYILMSIFLCGSLQKFIELAEKEEEHSILHRLSYSVKVEGLVEKREGYRDKWLQACCIYVDACQNEIRNHIPAVYTWLYRHDKQWLQENSPAYRKRGGNKSFADWAKRDDDLATGVTNAAERIKSYTGKPVQISITRIGKELGCGNLLYSKAEKLPKTKREVLRVIEDNHAFRLRRINWAISELTQKGLPIVMWRVMRLAGIRDELWNKYWAMIIKTSD